MRECGVTSELIKKAEALCEEIAEQGYTAYSGTTRMLCEAVMALCEELKQNSHSPVPIVVREILRESK